MAEDKNEREFAGANSIDAARLNSFIERLETLEEEKKSISDDIKEVKKEVKDASFDVKTIERLIKRRKEDRRVVEMEDNILDAYEKSLRVYLKSLGVK